MRAKHRIYRAMTKPGWHTLGWLLILLALVTETNVSAATTAFCTISGRIINQKGRAILPVIQHTSERYGVSTALIFAVVKIESNFKPLVISAKGARGLMQLMPKTQQELGVMDVFDIRENVAGGTRYIRMLLLRFGDVRKALWAYNTGPGNVDKNRIPAETRRFANAVLSYYWCFNQRGWQ